jgi:hypothetical protein
VAEPQVNVVEILGVAFEVGQRGILTTRRLLEVCRIPDELVEVHVEGG